MLLDGFRFSRILSSMDSATLGQYSGYIALLISMGAMIIGVVNHRRIRSNCCGRQGSLSLDIEATTPETKPIIRVDAESLGATPPSQRPAVQN